MNNSQVKLKTEKEKMQAWGSQEKTDKPLVTILCHTYQHKDYINDALVGFLMQETAFPYEIIVRDDASTDGTREMVEEYARQYPNIIKPILETTNQFSKGVKPYSMTFPLAKGKYVALCEGDDYWQDKNKLSIQAAFLEQNDEYVITYHDAITIDDNGGVISESVLGDKKIDYTKEQLLFSGVMPTLTRFFRNVVPEFPPECDNVVAGDLFLASLLSKYGGAKYIDSIKPSVYRIHGGGVWAGVNDLKRSQILAVAFFWLSMYYKRIGDNKASNKIALAAMMHFSEPLKPSKATSLKFFIYSLSHKAYKVLQSAVRKIL